MKTPLQVLLRKNKKDGNKKKEKEEERSSSGEELERKVKWGDHKAIRNPLLTQVINMELEKGIK